MIKRQVFYFLGINFFIQKKSDEKSKKEEKDLTNLKKCIIIEQSDQQAFAHPTIGHVREIPPSPLIRGHVR